MYGHVFSTYFSVEKYEIHLKEGEEHTRGRLDGHHYVIT